MAGVELQSPFEVALACVQLPHLNHERTWRERRRMCQINFSHLVSEPQLFPTEAAMQGKEGSQRRSLTQVEVGLGVGGVELNCLPKHLL